MSSFKKEISKLSPVKIALLASELRANESIERAAAAMEPIAIVGMACRLPASNSPEEFWNLLINKRDGTTEIPDGRFGLNMEKFYDPNPAAPGRVKTRRGGLVDQAEIEGFDPEFFGLSPRECRNMDPQQRLVLKAAWEALESAGINPEKLKGSRTGVFIGASTWDFYNLTYSVLERVDGHAGTGTAQTLMSGRLSHFLGLSGPSMVIDTACSSTLVSVHYACESLRRGEADMFIAGGTNLMLSPENYVAFSKAGMLSPDGRCATFDAAANGYCRAEGIGVFVLKRLSDALANNDNIVALIRGTAINHAGKNASVAVPNEISQRECARLAMESGGVNPEDITYVEAHGTGTKVGDPIEVRAMMGAYCNGRSEKLPMGSNKTNIGHGEGVSGVPSIIKVAMSFAHKVIPATLNFKQINPEIKDSLEKIVIPTENLPWEPKGKRRMAGINSSGFGGTNAHIIMEEAPDLPARERRSGVPYLFTISARNKPALARLYKKYMDWIAGNPTATIGDICYTTNISRGQFSVKKVFLVDSLEGLKASLTMGPDAADFISAYSGASDISKLTEAANQYLSGQDVSWVQLYGDQDLRKVPLPTYAFAIDKLWLAAPESLNLAPAKRAA